MGGGGKEEYSRLFPRLLQKKIVLGRHKCNKYHAVYKEYQCLSCIRITKLQQQFHLNFWVMFEPEILMKCNTECASYLAAVNIMECTCQ